MKKDTQEAAFRQRVLEYYQNGHTVTDTANRYHLSRKTVHKWLKRWDGTWKSLVDRSRRPKTSPRKQSEERDQTSEAASQKVQMAGSYSCLSGSNEARIYTQLWMFLQNST